MKSPANDLRKAENAIFDALEQRPGDRTHRGVLYRDGIPTPSVYLAQPIRVLFVFREPNMGGTPYAHDMREEVSDERFRHIGSDGVRTEVSPKSWWNGKAGMFAHAVAAVLDGERAAKAYRRFSSGGWNHDVVNRFGYIQIKKVGGGGTSKPDEIREYAQKYAGTLKDQIALYRPDLLIGCGTGKHSPAELLAEYVVPNGQRLKTAKTTATWWKFPTSTLPAGLVQLWHPARRGDRRELYNDVWGSVDEVARRLGLIKQSTITGP